MAEPFSLTNDSDVTDAVRNNTSYSDTGDELPQSQLDALLNDAKRDMAILTDSTKWYDDLAYGQALKAWTNILAKAAVENIAIDSYSIADEQISLTNADPEDSQQIQMWLTQVNRSLDKSDLSFEDYSNRGMSNTSSYIG